MCPILGQKIILRLMRPQLSVYQHDLLSSIPDDQFEKIYKKWGTPEIDLFASRLNHRVLRYCSWRPDPHAYAVDALILMISIKCMLLPSGCFPEFSKLGRTQKHSRGHFTRENMLLLSPRSGRHSPSFQYYSSLQGKNPWNYTPTS